MTVKDFLKENNISIEQLDAIIKEQAMAMFNEGSEEKIEGNEIKSLKEKKAEIEDRLSKLMESREGVEEGLFDLFRGDPEKKRQKALKWIYTHRVRKGEYEKYKQIDPERAEKYVQFFIKNGDTKYANWSNKLNDYIPTGVHSVGSAEQPSSGGGSIREEEA